MKAADIRKTFLEFFQSKGHTIVASSPVVPGDDPTLLFTNAGMNQFKDVFLGFDKRPYTRATTSQKCIRAGGKHNDLDNVGYTARHHTFFEMLGNFSFGDYFKRDAINYAWELLTKEFKLPADKLTVTVYAEDDEAYDIWTKEVGVPAERVIRIGDNKGARYASDNFWMMGDTGPCGPCTEIFYDHGPDIAGGPPGSPDEDGDRFIEIWNNVFMQFNRDEAGVMHPLPKPSVDTGMGLERIAAVLQHVHANYEIDLFQHLLQAAADAIGCTNEQQASLKVVADHARSCSFLIADGVVPSNEGRGYVLRRITRRAIRHGYKLGARTPFFHKLVHALVEQMGEAYPELRQNEKRITDVLKTEEERFFQTIAHGMEILDGALASLDTSGARQIDGETAFKLHDTYGFPIDLTMEMAAEVGLDVDREGFERLMGEQRERAKADARSRKAGLTSATVYKQIMESGGRTTFTGYDQVTTGATITGLVRDGEAVPAAQAGETVEVVLDRSPFYAEAGGQLGDHGVIELADGTRLDVFDVQIPVPGLWVHRATVVEGTAEAGSAAVGTIDMSRRRAISRAHTATHMIHKAFREHLGDTATQMGSENAPGRLRFDFPSSSAIAPSVLADVEARVNEVLLDDLPVFAQQMKIDQARQMGAMALFGEKYGDTVRVISIGDWAHELCGGTHAMRSGQLGVVSFLSEGSIGAGVRRLEALVGADAYQFLAREHTLVNHLTELVKVRPEDLPQRVEALMVKLKDAERELERVRKAQLSTSIEGIIGTGADIGPFRLWTFTLPDNLEAKDLRDVGKGVGAAIRGTTSGFSAVQEGQRTLAVLQEQKKLEQQQLDALNKAVKALVGIDANTKKPLVDVKVVNM